MYKVPDNALFLIDGSALLYRSYYGLRPLHTSKGVPSQATYGFVRAIRRIIEDFNPKEILVIWDSKGKTVRHEEYKEYKATRDAPPSDLFVQKEHITQFLDLIELTQLSKTGYEADDLIGDMVKDNRRRNIVIVGPDKDLYQLIDDNVVILDPMKKEVTDREEFIKKRGFEPEKLVFFHALVGDSSDNIPGVKGIGKKSAEELVKKFETLEELYKNLDSIEKARIRNGLEANKENAFLSYKLFQLRECDVKVSKEERLFDKSKWNKAAPLFQELEFTSMLRGMSVVEQQLDITQMGGEKKKKSEWTCHIIQTEQALDDLIAHIKKEKYFAFDTETTGLRPLIDELVGLSFCLSKKEAYYLPFSHVGEDIENPIIQLDREAALKKLKPLFESTTIKKVAHHAKFDRLGLWHYGVRVNNIVFDTILAAGLLRTEWSRLALDKLSAQLLGEEMETYKKIVGKKKSFANVPLEKAGEYAAHDALQTFKLVGVLEKKLNTEKDLKKLYTTIDFPCSQVLFDMECAGIYLDTEKLATAAKSVKRSLTILEDKIVGAIKHKKIAGAGELNLNSPKQIEKLLFDDLKLPAVKKSSKGQRSTDHEVLTKLSEVHPVPGLILKHRELYKLLSTYLEPLPHEVNPATERVHTSYSQTLVVTGRLSSSLPNLQNIPATEGYGMKVREAFCAPRGRMFLSADYSQIELRVLAFLSKDKTLRDIFEHDEDIHRQTASQLFDVAPDKVTSKQRQIGKRINFSIMYGMTPFGLAKDLGIKPGEAAEYIDKYFERYPGVAKWMENTVQDAKKTGYVSTWFGRRRYVAGLRETNKNLFMQAKRAAVNSPVQGTQADLMKMAMINLHDVFLKKKMDAQMILQIHDEVLIEAASVEIDEVKKVAEKTLEHVVDWPVPLKVTLRTGKNWADVTK